MSYEPTETLPPDTAELPAVPDEWPVVIMMLALAGAGITMAILATWSLI